MERKNANKKKGKREIIMKGNSNKQQKRRKGKKEIATKGRLSCIMCMQLVSYY